MDLIVMLLFFLFHHIPSPSQLAEVKRFFSDELFSTGTHLGDTIFFNSTS